MFKAWSIIVACMAATIATLAAWVILIDAQVNGFSVIGPQNHAGAVFGTRMLTYAQVMNHVDQDRILLAVFLSAIIIALGSLRLGARVRV